MDFHRFLINSNDNKINSDPEKTNDTRPKMNAGSTVISITLKIIETNTKRDVLFKIIGVTPNI